MLKKVTLVSKLRKPIYIYIYTYLPISVIYAPLFYHWPLPRIFPSPSYDSSPLFTLLNFSLIEWPITSPSVAVAASLGQLKEPRWLFFVFIFYFSRLTVLRRLICSRHLKRKLRNGFIGISTRLYYMGFSPFQWLIVERSGCRVQWFSEISS